MTRDEVDLLALYDVALPQVYGYLLARCGDRHARRGPRGSGPTVSGNAEVLLLAITGRTAALGLLSGDGLPTLQARLS